MKRLNRIRWSLAAVAGLPLLAGSALLAHAADGPAAKEKKRAAVSQQERGADASRPEERNAEWVELFDGHSLKGWEQKNGEAKYEVKDGAILGSTAEGSPNSFLCSTKNYGDFVLEFDGKLMRDNLNSGVQIRSRSTADYQNGRVHGPQVEIENSPGEAGYIYGEATGRGWLSEDLTKNNEAFRSGEWNHFRVEATGPRIRTWINGTPIADLTDEQSYKAGFIGLQVHGYKGEHPAQVAWKNIRIQDLGGATVENDPTPPPQPAKPKNQNAKKAAGQKANQQKADKKANQKADK